MAGEIRCPSRSSAAVMRRFVDLQNGYDMRYIRYIYIIYWYILIDIYWYIDILIYIMYLPTGSYSIIYSIYIYDQSDHAKNSKPHNHDWPWYDMISATSDACPELWLGLAVAASSLKFLTIFNLWRHFQKEFDEMDWNGWMYIIVYSTSPGSVPWSLLTS
jgi:hypothetical protein